MIDLHTHSNASDGLLAPSELIEKARSAGASVLALTDHDTTAGLDEAERAAKAAAIEFVPGVEVSAHEGPVEVHLLGYFLDRTDEPLRAFLDAAHRARLDRVEGMVARLRDIGIAVSIDDLVPDRATAGSMGRPHVARLLVRLGHARSIDDAFRRFLGRSAPCYVPRPKVDVADAIAVMKGAGGLAVIAHPGIVREEGVVEAVTAQGIDGIEVFHPDHNATAVERWADYARRRRLLVTGGSDFHGEAAERRVSRLGACACPADEFARLRDAAGRRRGTAGPPG